METDHMDFECMTCGKMFERTWFDISRTRERVRYKSPTAVDEVEISFGDGIGVFCSRACLEGGRAAVMQEQGVPIPTDRPDIGPIEACARCSGPVDMSDWHLTFSEGKLEGEGGSVATLEFDYLAVVCKRCSPSQSVGGTVADEVMEQPKAESCEKVPAR